MYEDLDEPFRQLARALHSVQIWAQEMLCNTDLKPTDLKLVEKLLKYADQCQRNMGIWSNKNEARRVTKKLDNLWAALLLDVIMKDDKRNP